MYLIYWDYRQIYDQAFAFDIIDVKKYLEIVSAKSLSIKSWWYDFVSNNL